MEINDLSIDDLDLQDSEDEVVSQENESDEKSWMGADSSEEESELNEDNNDNEDSTNLIDKLLNSRGIDSKSIKIENEDGDVEEVDFYSLSPEDQFELLKYNPNDADYGLDNDEIDLINEIRGGNLSVSEYKDMLRQNAIKDYLESSEDVKYEIDSIPDDELFILDLKTKIDDLSEEDANSELELAKQNEALFKRKIEGIRNEYKQREDALIQQEKLEQEEEYNKQQEEFENLIVETLENNDSIEFGDNKLSLSEDDLNEIASFILDSDAAGIRYIAKALNDPKTLIEMSWYALKGKEAFAQISDYYKKEISKVAKENYSKGYEDARSGKASNLVKTVVTRPTSKKNQKNEISIDDLD